MASGTAYADIADYKAALAIEGTDSDARITSALIAASRLLDQRLGRYFGRNATDAVRVYDAPVGQLLRIDDLARPPTAVMADTDAEGTSSETVTDYRVEPQNAPSQPEPEPFTHIWFVNRPAHRVRVTGTFGWPEVPAAISEATIQIAALILMDGPRATGTRTTLAGASETVSREARGIVAALSDTYARLPPLVIP